MSVPTQAHWATAASLGAKQEPKTKTAIDFGAMVRQVAG
jgi:hypothetical protein